MCQKCITIKAFQKLMMELEFEEAMDVCAGILQLVIRQERPDFKGAVVIGDSTTSEENFR